MTHDQPIELARRAGTRRWVVAFQAAVVGVQLATALGCTRRWADEPRPRPDTTRQPTGDEVCLDTWGVHFRLPSSAWQPSRTIEEQDRTLYLYARSALVDTLGREIRPGITIACETVRADWDVIEYSAALRASARVRWQIDEVFSHVQHPLSLRNAVGYRIRYLDDTSTEHTAYVVHAKHDSIGLQIITDVTSELFPAVREDWDALVTSFAFIP